MLNMLRLHQRLYNAALEQRITAWRRLRQHVTFAEQCRDLTELRADDELYAGLSAQSAQVTLKRLDLAFRAFFRRVEARQTPGFPRFRSFERFSGWGYKTHGDGFRFTFGDGNRHGRLRLSGVGTMLARGRARSLGDVVTCEIQYRAERWYASLTIACVPQRKHGNQKIGMDWGVETFATLASEGGLFVDIENPRFMRTAKAGLQAAQQGLSRKRRGSKNRHKAKRIVARIHRKTVNRRREFLHQQSARIIASARLIATEGLAVANMTRSARGTIEDPGRNVTQKAGLNREILSTAPTAFLSMLRYKAAEAGIAFVKVPTRTVKPSQRCSGCWSVRKKTLSDRQHVCACGTVLNRDRNAARVNLLWALAQTGREPTGCLASVAS